MRHLKIYRAIKLIQQTGSIRKAAADLSISPSALNRSVQAFEDELSIPIFERISGGVRLSEAGEFLFDVIDRHLTEFDELQRQLGNMRDGDFGELRISIGDDIAGGLLLSCIAELENSFPGVSVDVISDNSVASLRERRVHLALLTNPATDDHTEVLYAHACPLVGWQGPGQTAPARAIWQLEGLRVLLPMEGTGSHTVISHLLRRHRISLGARSSLSAAQIVQYLQWTDGIAVFPKIVLDAQSLAAPNQKLGINFGTVQVCALRLASVPLIRPAQAFLAILERRFEQ